MTEKHHPAEPTVSVSVACDVLPILRLARFASEAGHYLGELRYMREAVPTFNDQFTRMLNGLATPEEVCPAELVAGALRTAESMLDAVVAKHGGDL